MTKGMRCCAVEVDGRVSNRLECETDDAIEMMYVYMVRMPVLCSSKLLRTVRAQRRYPGAEQALKVFFQLARTLCFTRRLKTAVVAVDVGFQLIRVDFSAWNV